MRPPIGQAALFWHTVRHLKPIQIGGRAWFRLYRPRPKKAPGPSRRVVPGEWVLTARRRQSQTGPQSFRFLSLEGDLSGGWDNPVFAKLWRYNLHYFDDLNAEGASARTQWHTATIVRWITENPPAGGTGWEPYPTSLRIVNWVKWSLSGHTIPTEALQSLVVQVRWLRQRLEYHLLGNHLFANAKALIFAGSFFDGGEARGWLDLGLRILRHEIPRQILADGAHFELSTMYHALVLEDLLDLVNVMRAAGVETPEGWHSRINAMRLWLAGMSHPDGEIAFFNDAAFGISPSPTELESYASRLGYPELAAPALGCCHFPDSGYVRFQGGRAAVLIDVARIGPDHLPGHAHADTLSFELSVDGQRVLVNSGTSVYATGAERLRQRGTAAHNTVVVDGENSSEVWSAFRVARRARPFDLKVESDTITCCHDGYARKPGRAIHRRTWHFGNGRLAVVDRVNGVYGEAIATFHFCHGLTPVVGDDHASGTLILGERVLVCWRVEKGEARIEPTSWHPEFGSSLPSSCLRVALAGGESVVAFSWMAD